MGLKSLGQNTWSKVTQFEQKFSQSNQSRVGFGLGTIAIGVLGNEPILSPENLYQDLHWAKESKVEEVFIFRLGGLNELYMSEIKKSLN